MSTAVLNMIKQLDKKETDQVVDYVQYILSKREKYSLKEGYEVFRQIREEARLNGTQGMTLDEINDEIKAARKERCLK